MGKVLLCMGKYAENPYFVEKAYANVYSIEELCYCLIQNADFIDRDIIDMRLIDWIETECGLKELSERLWELLKEECSAGSFVEAILKDTGYAPYEEITAVRKHLESESGQNVYEKKKARADCFTENKKYAVALRQYESLLEEVTEDRKELRAKIFHNRGVVLAGLFQYKNAAESFRQAAECDNAQESKIAYLAASRMWMEESEYLNFVAGQIPEYEISLAVEKLVEDAKKQFEATEESRMLFTLKVCREEKSSVSYYEEMEHITDTLKEQYREMAAE